MSRDAAAVNPCSHGRVTELAAEVRRLRRLVANAREAGHTGYADALRDKLFLAQVELGYASRAARRARA